MVAHYLVRFDDLCPGMNWDAWEAVEKILVELSVRPILAVVPDNRDASLDVAPPRADFWERVRSWQARGFAIGLHGYQHRYVTREAGVVGINRYSEFAGLPAAEQEEKLRAGLAIFAREGVRADVWVAPAHSFDAVTVAALARLGLRTISDGLFLFPHLDAHGVAWVPQQLWRFRPMPFGVWTVCYHVNRWGPRELEAFRRDLERHRAQIWSLPEALGAHGTRRPSWQEPLAEAALRAALWLKGAGGRALHSARASPRR